MSKIDEAKTALQEWLADGAVAAKELQARADAAAISWRMLEDAKSELGILSQKRGNQWYWVPDIPEAGDLCKADTLCPDHLCLDEAPVMGTSETGERVRAARQERERLQDALKAQQDRVTELDSGLRELAQDEAAFRAQHARRTEAEGEVERLTFLLADAEQKLADAEAAFAAEERASAEREYRELDEQRRHLVTELETALQKVAEVATALRENERQRQLIAGTLGQSVPRRSHMIIEGLANKILDIGDGRYRHRVDQLISTTGR